MRPLRPCHAAAAAWLALAALLLSTVFAQDTQLTESKLKAAYLFNFAKFVEWPPEVFADSNSPFVIGVIGDAAFAHDLELLVHDKNINNRPIVVKPCLPDAVGTNCHVLFIASSEKGKVPENPFEIGRCERLDRGGIRSIQRERRNHQFLQNRKQNSIPN